MEGSSESGSKKPDKSRGLNAYTGSSGRLELLHGERLGIAGDASNNVGCEEGDDVSLRHWLDRRERVIDHIECLHIFKQIVEIVNLAHSQGIVVHNVKPSCFVLSSFNCVSFIESSSCPSSGSESDEDALNNRITGGQCSSSPSPLELLKRKIRLGHEESPLEILPAVASEKIEDNSKVEEVEEPKNNFKLKQILHMESSWYTSPEEDAGAPSSFSSDIFCLGVLLFELFCTFTSIAEKLRTMSNLRHRVLPPHLLLNWSKEASFCLWLLHPQPSTRPKMIEVLQSEFLSEPADNLEELEASIKLEEEIEEQELLLEFLSEIQRRKKEDASKLHEAICCLSSDIEVLKQQLILKKKGGLYPQLNKDDPLALQKVDHLSPNPVRNEDLTGLGSRKRCRPKFQIHGEEEFNGNLGGFQMSEMRSEKWESILSKSSRLMKNFKQLESAYFSTRCRTIRPTEKVPHRCSQMSSDGKGSIVITQGSSVDNLGSKEQSSEGRKSGWINPFLEGMCKYLSFSKLKVRADLKQGDLLGSSNLVCSMSFDSNKEFFATAGVNRKIKIFECNMILKEDRDIHYPVIEMTSRSKLSSICWNSYIQSQIASSDFEGVVQIWDVMRGQVFMEMREHERRVWSVDFSLVDPMKLASGSDDGAVKLWNINQGGSIGTIKTKANVCCVQFPPDSARSLAVGSADHKIYCYDLRNTKIPLSTLIGHTKTVSYVKYVDSTTLVSASTDNSLKLWDLSTCTSRVIDSPIQTFTGHTNSRNFVGLSIYDGYIATGSETNEVFIYHKAFPMPVMSFAFNSTDPLSCHEVDEPFISSVCWRGQSTLLAANSTGNIKLLEMD